MRGVGTDLAVAYLRVSDRKQLNTAADIDPDGNSIATQRRIVEQRAETLPARIVEEFVEPGVSAQSVEKRPEFQKMLTYLQQHPQIKYVIVYMRSRAFRNYIDAALTKRQLDLMGVKLISAKEDFGDGIYGDMMAAITDIFNDTQNRLSGQDISTKMQHKAMNGGTCSRAKLGYVNTRIIVEGHQVNTVEIDPERGPLVTRAWELYASGDYTLEALQATMADLGLTCRPTARRPVPTPPSAATLHNMLRDPYYVGYVVWKGQMYPGRHQPLVTEELFHNVQEVLSARSANGNRARIHNHYLKGTLFCGRCRDAGETSRLFFSTPRSRNGTHYEYFVCRRATERQCDLPALPRETVEAAIAEHYRSLRLPDRFAAETRRLLEEVVTDEQSSVRQMHADLNRKLADLDAKESRLIDLLADDLMPADKVHLKLIELRGQRKRIEAGIANTTEQLTVGASVLRHALDLITDPYALYQGSSDEVRRRLNATFYRRFYLDDLAESVTTSVRDDKCDIFADLHAAAQSQPDSQPEKSDELRNMRQVAGSYKSVMVVPAGFEPATSRV